MPAKSAIELDTQVSPESLEQEARLPGPLLVQACSLVAQRKDLLELVASVDRKIDSVKAEIAERVRGDYARRLEQLEEEFQPVRAELVGRLHSLTDHERLLQSKLQQIDDQLAELDFRVRVGELSEPELPAMSASLITQREGWSAAFETVQEALNSLEPLLEDFAQLRADRATASSEEAATKGVDSLPQRSPVGPDDVTGADQTTTVIKRRTALEGDDTVPRAPLDRAASAPAAASLSPAAIANALPSEPGWLFRIGIAAGSDESKSYRLDGAVFTLGRARSNDAVIQGASVSRLHAVIRWQGDGFVIEDASSGGGVVINGEPSKRHLLEDGDMVQIEAASFLFRVSL